MSVWAWQDHEQVCGFSTKVLVIGKDQRVVSIYPCGIQSAWVGSHNPVVVHTIGLEAFLSTEKRSFDPQSTSDREHKYAATARRR